MNKMKKILIVEDETDIRELVAFHLEKEGFSALQASTGEAGLSMLWDENIDLVILDLMMPGVDGISLMGDIRSIDASSRVPILAVSGLNDAATLNDALLFGAMDYLVKPFDLETLLSKIKKAVEISRKRAQKTA